MDRIDTPTVRVRLHSGSFRKALMLCEKLGKPINTDQPYGYTANDLLNTMIALLEEVKNNDSTNRPTQ